MGAEIDADYRALKNIRQQQQSADEIRKAVRRYLKFRSVPMAGYLGVTGLAAASPFLVRRMIQRKIEGDPEQYQRSHALRRLNAVTRF